MQHIFMSCLQYTLGITSVLPFCLHYTYLSAFRWRSTCQSLMAVIPQVLLHSCILCLPHRHQKWLSGLCLHHRHFISFLFARNLVLYVFLMYIDPINGRVRFLEHVERVMPLTSRYLTSISYQRWILHVHPNTLLPWCLTSLISWAIEC